MPGVGSPAPEFELRDQSGQICRLSEMCQAGPVVLFFYPKDETTVCTMEACGFRDQHERFLEFGAQVVGISRDSVESHASFAQHHSLPYRLLQDPNGKVAAAFGVKKVLGLMPGRATFVIDRERMIRMSYASALAAQAHVEQSLALVQKLS